MEMGVKRKRARSCPNMYQTGNQVEIRKGSLLMGYTKENIRTRGEKIQESFQEKCERRNKTEQVKEHLKSASKITKGKRSILINRYLVNLKSF